MVYRRHPAARSEIPCHIILVIVTGTINLVRYRYFIFNLSLDISRFRRTLHLLGPDIEMRHSNELHGAHGIITQQSLIQWCYF